MWTLCIDSGNQQTDTVRALAIRLCVRLSAVADARGDFGKEDGAVVCEARGQRLLLHEVGEHSSIRGETGKGNAIMCVDWDDLALVGGELFCVAL